jgi:hypothetical protein
MPKQAGANIREDTAKGQGTGINKKKKEWQERRMKKKVREIESEKTREDQET